jgi:hypothetical protein
MIYIIDIELDEDLGVFLHLDVVVWLETAYINRVSLVSWWFVASCSVWSRRGSYQLRSHGAIISSMELLEVTYSLSPKLGCILVLIKFKLCK